MVEVSAQWMKKVITVEKCIDALLFHFSFNKGNRGKITAHLPYLTKLDLRVESDQYSILLLKTHFTIFQDWVGTDNMEFMMSTILLTLT